MNECLLVKVVIEGRKGRDNHNAGVMKLRTLTSILSSHSLYLPFHTCQTFHGQPPAVVRSPVDVMNALAVVSSMGWDGGWAAMKAYPMSVPLSLRSVTIQLLIVLYCRM